MATVEGALSKVDVKQIEDQVLRFEIIDGKKQIGVIRKQSHGWNAEPGSSLIQDDVRRIGKAIDRHRLFDALKNPKSFH